MWLIPLRQRLRFDSREPQVEFTRRLWCESLKPSATESDHTVFPFIWRCRYSGTYYIFRDRIEDANPWGGCYTANICVVTRYAFASVRLCTAHMGNSGSPYPQDRDADSRFVKSMRMSTNGLLTTSGGVAMIADARGVERWSRAMGVHCLTGDPRPGCVDADRRGYV